jgi:hypothetical protein
MNPNQPQDDELMNRLRALRAVSPRSSQRARQGRENFLAQAQTLNWRVTETEKARHIGWISKIFAFERPMRKETRPMFGTLATITLIASLLFGSGGVLVASAQSSQPDDGLYGLKLWSEDVRLDVTSDSQSQFDLLFSYFERRSEELQTMLQSGEQVDEQVETRYAASLQNALQAALNLPDDDAAAALAQLQTRLQSEQQTMAQLNLSGANLEAAMTQLRVEQMVQERLMLMEDAQNDPVQLREKLREQDQLHQSTATATPEPQATDDDSVEAIETETERNDDKGGGNPWTTGTPTPGSGYGSGSDDCLTCTPQENEYDYDYDHSGENNPWTTDVPTPGSSYGPGPGTQPTESEDRNENSPQPTVSSDDHAEPPETGGGDDNSPSDPPGSGGGEDSGGSGRP